MPQEKQTPAPVETVDTDGAGKAPWSDPVCYEMSIAEITQAGGPGVTDAGILS